MKRRHIILTTTQLILLSFLAAIIIGAVLLSLPISTKSGAPIPFIDALFTATTATCVTGLVTVPTVTTWSIFGQAVILILIQIGGLGIITMASGLMICLHQKIGLGDRILIRDAFNLNTLFDLTKFIKKVIIGTFVIEGIGAICYLPVFVPAYGAKGIWISVFNAVSAFCNAGIDIVSQNSLTDYALHPLINFVTCTLIVLGGLGFIVWWDVLRVIKTIKHRKLRSLTLHSKIVLSATAVLILGGALLFFIFETNNPLTMAGHSIWDKIQLSLFQSVTTRTAGFATLPQQNLTNASAFLSLFLMFIGGSPVGTAGGIKTATLVVLIASAHSVIKNKNEITLFGRSIPQPIVLKAAAVTLSSFFTMFFSTVLLSAVTHAPALDVIYETVSATATVGLTRDLTSLLNFAGKIIIIFTMYFGRVGPISLAFAFRLRKSKPDRIKNPAENVSVG